LKNRERRGSVRIGSRTEIQYRADAIRAEGFIEDLSEAGAWIDTLQPLPVGTKIVFQFFLLDDKPDVPITGSATVMRVQQTVGMAVEFGHLDPETVARIRFFVGALFFGQDPSALPSLD
jgi:hypothetical protein